jgi:hypothetical protein
MQDSSIQAQVAEAKAEIAKLRQQLSIGVAAVHKDLSSILLVPRRSGFESATLLEEFIESVGNAAQLRRCTTADCVHVAVLKLAEPTRSFYNTCLELHAKDATWDKFKKAFRQVLETPALTNSISQGCKRLSKGKRRAS